MVYFLRRLSAMRSDAPHPTVQSNISRNLRVVPCARTTGVCGHGLKSATHILQLAFETKDLRTICEDSTAAIDKLGLKVAGVLTHRLGDIDSAKSINDLVAGKPHVRDDGDLHIDLIDGYGLVCRANHQRNPTTSSGSIDWEKVIRIKIVSITKE